MFTFFYRPNFCPDCGAKISPKNFGWQEKILLTCFCSNCFKRLRFVLVKKHFISLISLCLLFLLSNKYFHSSTSSSPTNLATNSLNKETLIIPSPKPNPYSTTNAFIKTENFICGAKTRKGKKCQRKVKVLGYCWQHK